MSTIKDVAKMAGVSIGTVSNYITKSRPVKQSTAKTIQNAIIELNYKANAFAKNLRNGVNYEVGIVLPNTSDQYYSYILSGIENVLTKSRYYFNLALTNDVAETETKILNSMLEKNICGLIIITSQPQNKEFFLENFINNNIPVVFIDRKIAGIEHNFIAFNNYNTARYIFEEIYKQGFKKIGLVLGLESFSCEEECKKAYLDFCIEKGIEYKEKHILHISQSKEEAFRRAITFLQEQSPNIIFTTSQTLLNGISRASSLIGLRAGKEIFFVSLGQELWSSNIKDMGITGTMRPAHTLGKSAANLLTENIEAPLLFEKQEVILEDKIISKEVFSGTDNPKNFVSKKEVLKLLFLESPNAYAIKKLKPNFMQKTGIDLDITMCDHDLIMQRILSNKKYDIIMYDNPWLDYLAEKNCFYNLNDFINSKEFDKESFLFDILERVGNHKGNYYGVPFLYGPQLLLYRKDLFENYEIKKQFEKIHNYKLDTPRTWYEFNIISKFFTQKYNKKSPVKYGTSVASSTQENMIPELMPRLWACGASIFDSKQNITVNTPKFRRGIVNFIETYNYTNQKNKYLSIDQTMQEFYSGKTAMLLVYASFIADENNYRKSGVIGKVGYAHIPGGCSVLGSWGLSVAQNSTKKDSALKFLKWVSDPNMSNYFTILEGQSPLKNVFFNDEMLNHYPWLTLIYDTYSYNRQRKSIVKNNSRVPIILFEKIVYENIVLILDGKLSMEDALLKMQQELEALVNVGRH